MTGGAMMDDAITLGLIVSLAAAVGCWSALHLRARRWRPDETAFDPYLGGGDDDAPFEALPLGVARMILLDRLHSRVNHWIGDREAGGEARETALAAAIAVLADERATLEQLLHWERLRAAGQARP